MNSARMCGRRPLGFRLSGFSLPILPMIFEDWSCVIDASLNHVMPNLEKTSPLCNFVLYPKVEFGV